MNAVFELSGVTYRYDAADAPALNDISLRIEQGKRIALLGANGSGKSTLLRTLDGLFFPASGSIRFRGQTLDRSQLEQDSFAFDFRRCVGMVFQNPDMQLFNPTVFDEIAFAPLQLGLPKDEVIRRVKNTLERMELSQLQARPPHRLSGGEKKRVALASVLVLDPEVLLFDEPTAGLDPRSESQIIDMLIGWGGEGRTVITATHDLGLVEDIADYCFVMEEGRIAAEGDPAAVLRDLEMLRRVNLIHEHRHRHETGEVHSHPHRRPHRH
ncbi:MAG: ABC transporter ATP-binding protein [Bryobacteraceae bacterium]